MSVASCNGDRAAGARVPAPVRSDTRSSRGAPARRRGHDRGARRRPHGAPLRAACGPEALLVRPGRPAGARPRARGQGTARRPAPRAARRAPPVRPSAQRLAAARPARDRPGCAARARADAQPARRRQRGLGEEPLERVCGELQRGSHVSGREHAEARDPADRVLTRSGRSARSRRLAPLPAARDRFVECGRERRARAHGRLDLVLAVRS